MNVSQKLSAVDPFQLPCSSSGAHLAQPLILLPDELHVIHILFLCFAVPLGRLQCSLHIDHAFIKLHARAFNDGLGLGGLLNTIYGIRSTNLQAQVHAGNACTLGFDCLDVIEL